MNQQCRTSLHARLRHLNLKLLHSRVHPLRHIDTPNVCYVKREDELSFGLSGSKKRKYASLIPHLLKEGIEYALVIGSAHSNNVLAACQLLRENDIHPILFLLGPPPSCSSGNFLLTHLFVPTNSIHWISREQWPQVQNLAQEHIDALQRQGHKAFLLKEGGSNKEALMGALTLGIDLIENEQEQGFAFDHALIDAGTGLMAAALILLWTYLQKKGQIHVLLLAEKASCFLNTLDYWQKEFERQLQCSLQKPTNFALHRPITGKSFGSVNTTVLKAIQKIARDEGILTDPIYSAKLFLSASTILQPYPDATAVLIHSGGALSLAGFQPQLFALLNNVE